MLTILLDGLSYGMLLFVLACGLSVTLGLMNFVNLAHGAFALVGGYTATILGNRYGVPFLALLPIAFLVAGLAGVVLERLLYRRLYGRDHLDQVLFSIGLVFMTIAAVDYALGSSQQFVRLPSWLEGRVAFLGAEISLYRLFVAVFCGLIALALQGFLIGTRFGSRLRAAVDDPRVAAGLGIDVERVFAVTFGVGCGLAGLGGALGANLVGMDPTFPIKFLISFLIVVTVGGTTGIWGAFLAALLLGVADVAGKYYVPSVGAFIIYAMMVFVLIVRPQGLFARSTR